MGNQETYVERFADSIEEPTMRVDLLLILGLEHKDDLNRNQIVGVVGLGKNQLWCRVDRELSRVLHTYRE